MRAKDSTNQYASSHFSTYWTTYEQTTDSIIRCVDSMLGSYKTEYFREWHIDSLICINSTNDKLITTVNESYGISSQNANDQIEKLLGKKIDGKWFFFKAGESLVVPREMYGKSGEEPLTFYELSQIARKEFLESALVKTEKGEYIVSDKWIDAHFYNNALCAKCVTTEDFDQAHLKKIGDKWKYKIDTNEFKPLRKHKFNE